jgi:hypothetical protein
VRPESSAAFIPRGNQPAQLYTEIDSPAGGKSTPGLLSITLQTLAAAAALKSSADAKNGTAIGDV